MRIGQKVEVISPSSPTFGLRGVIVDLDDSRKHNIGVEFYSRVSNGHSCDGEGQEGRCRWHSEAQLQLVGAVSSSSQKPKEGNMMKTLSRVARTLFDPDLQLLIEEGVLTDNLQVADVTAFTEWQLLSEIGKTKASFVDYMKNIRKEREKEDKKTTK